MALVVVVVVVEHCQEFLNFVRYARIWVLIIESGQHEFMWSTSCGIWDEYIYIYINTKNAPKNRGVGFIYCPIFSLFIYLFCFAFFLIFSWLCSAHKWLLLVLSTLIDQSWQTIWQFDNVGQAVKLLVHKLIDTKKKRYKKQQKKVLIKFSHLLHM